MKKNVLTLLPCSYGGGAERLVLGQLENHNTNLFNYYVIALRRGNIEDQFSKYPSYRCLDASKRFSFHACKSVKRLIKEKNIELIHTHLFEADVYGFFIKLSNRKRKWISTRHNCDEFRKKTVWGLLNWFVTLWTDKVIAVSRTVEQFIHKYEHIPEKRMKCIYNGIDTVRFSPSDSSWMRARLDLKADDFIIGITGRLEDQKGHIYLLQGSRNLQQTIPEHKVLIVGDGALEEGLKEECRKLGIENNVLFLGFRENIEDFYNLFDVFCLPSKFEGLPLSVVEAMSCAKPVVCSDIPNNREIIENNVDGILVPVGHHEGIAEAINTIYKSPDQARVMGTKARKKVLKKFDFGKNLKAIEALYVQLSRPEGKRTID